MTPIRFLILALIACLFSPLPSRADIVILNDGKRMEGDIISEADDSIRMKYRITPKIWDEKTVMRSDIKEIVKQTPQEIEIVELRKILPTADLLPAEKYEKTVQDRLRPFVNKYAGTPEAKEAEEIIKTLLEEKRRAVSGEIKVEGEWISAEDAKLDRNNIEAFEIVAEMKKLADETDYLGALREFEKLRDYSKLYVASPQYTKAIPIVSDILEQYEAVIDRMIADQPVLSKLREENMKKLIEPDLSRTKNAIDAEVDSWKGQVESEKRLRMPWLTPYKYDLRSLQDVKKKISFLRTELETYDLAAIEAQNEELTKAIRAVASGDVATAESSYATAKEMGGHSSREFSRVLNSLLQQINKVKSAARQQQFAQGAPAFNPNATALAGTPGTTTDARVAQAMQAAQQGGPPSAAGAPSQLPPGQQAPVPAGTPAGAVPPGGAPPQQGIPGASVPPQQIPPQQIPPQALSAPAPSGGSSFQTLLYIGAGVMVLILLIAILSQKKKS